MNCANCSHYPVWHEGFMGRCRAEQFDPKQGACPCESFVASTAPRNVTMNPDEIAREVTRLRRLVNESLDKIQQLTKVA